MDQNDAIPVIDLSPWTTQSSNLDDETVRAAKRNCAAYLRRACVDVGFFYIKNHGVPTSLLESMLSASRLFFETATDEEKSGMAMSESRDGRGYQRLGQNITGGRRDWHEAVDFLRDDLGGCVEPVFGAADEEALRLTEERVLRGKNIFPTQPSNFHALYEEYVRAMLLLGKQCMKALATSLGLEEAYFEAKGLTNDSFWIMRCIRYPPISLAGAGVDDIADPGSGCGEHTDYGCLTFLLQSDDNPDALQVKTATGKWISGKPRDGCLLVNLGDAWPVWTGGLYRSTPHRVGHNISDAKDRISVPFFLEPNYNAIIEKINGIERACKDHVVPDHAIRDKTHGTATMCYGAHTVTKIASNFDFSDACLIETSVL